MFTKDTPRADHPVPSRTVPIGDNARVALVLLRQAYACAQDAGANPWDFAVEVGRLYETGLTRSSLRWLVAKRFAAHGQELSVYGAPHRSFQRGQGFFFDPRTCVVLTPGGAAFVDHLVVAVKPCWDSRRRELSLHGRVVKRFRVPAPNQELILSAFEEEGWPDHIHDPLPVSGHIDPRTRLHDAINRLNGRQVHRLLRFSGNGNGDGIFWECREPAGSRQTDNLGTAKK
jgi:hypothetical protein